MIKRSEGIMSPYHQEYIPITKLLRILVIFIIIAFPIIASAEEQTTVTQSKMPERPILSTKQIWDLYKDRIFTIISLAKTGTGFMFFETGIITCFHVVNGVDWAFAIGPGLAKPVPLDNLLHVDKSLDAAVLYVGEKIKPLPKASSISLEVGDRLVVIGSPQGLEQSVSEGILSGRRKVGDIEYLQLSTPISPGSSGSPVFNKYGEVVGMITSSIIEGQQLNFAITSDSFVQMNVGVPLSELSMITDPSGFYLLNIPQANFLANCPDFAIDIGVIPDDIKSSVSRAQISQWIEAELSRSAPTAVILTEEAQKEKYSQERNIRLGGADQLFRYLHLNIGYMISASDVSFITIELDFNRPVITMNGHGMAVVWSHGTYGYFGRGYNVADELRNSIQKLAKIFSDAWVIANKTKT